MATGTTKPFNGRDNENNWIWGVFYYNPADKRLLPPKRIWWLGWTVNFANPRSILFFVFILATVIFIGRYFK